MTNPRPDLVVDSVLEYIQKSDIYLNWITQFNLSFSEMGSACDIIYSVCLIDYPFEIPDKAIKVFFESVNQSTLYGSEIEVGDKYDFNAHGTAYILGAIQLLRSRYPVVTSNLIVDQKWAFDNVLDETDIPLYPRKFTYHSWRVSHWLGGVPSIILNIYNETGDYKFKELFDKVILSIEERAITLDGLIKVHRSTLGNFIFRNLYRLRHDPSVADIGGVVHILWLYHYTGRPYKSNERLLSLSLSLAKETDPFIEEIPYCLDFDFVQLIRTALEQVVEATDETEFFLAYKKNIESYLSMNMLHDENFTLHRLPGALAALHECRLYLNEDDGLDIIKLAGWL